MSDIFKRLITVVLILLSTSLFGQQVNLDWFDLNCGTNFDPVEHPEYKMDLGQTGGQHITSLGTLKVLIVFVQFAGETDENTGWPPGQAPIFMNDFIDGDVNQNSTNYLVKCQWGSLKLLEIVIV